VASCAELLDDVAPPPSLLRERWQTLPLSGQSAIVAAVLDHLTVNPGTRGLNRLDPARLTPVWRV